MVAGRRCGQRQEPAGHDGAPLYTGLPARQSPIVATPRTPGQMTPQEAAALIRDYQGELASPVHLELVKDLVRSVATDRRRVLQHTLSTLSGLVYWCEQQALPVTEQTLLDPAVIGRYVAQGMRNLGTGSRDNAHTSLRRVVRARQGRLFSDHRTREPGDRPDPKAPYTAKEVDGLLGWAAARQTELQRHSALAICALGFGGGLAARDLLHVRGSDISRGPDGTVTVGVGGADHRQTVLLRRYEDLALRLAQACGPGWIVNPRVDPTGPKGDLRLERQLPDKKYDPTTGPRLTVTRARITWICHHLATGTPLNVLATAAGVAPMSLAHYAPHLPHVNDADAAEVLRGA